MKVDKKVLIVEDEVLIREMLKEIFLSTFSNVLTASNGEQGLQIYRNELPDLVITDIKMKKMNGLTMIDEIQKINKKQNIVIITAYSDESHVKKAQDQKIKHFLVKPIDCNHLIKLSRKLLSDA